MSKSSFLATSLRRVGAVRLLDAFWGPTRLTVLVYHRIVDAKTDQFHYYDDVTLPPAVFERQMAYVAEHFNVIDLATLHAFLQNGEPLPSRPLLITFDDGYLDNYSNAWPILRAYHLPAVIFLTTARMDDPMPLWWDECAYYFHHTPHLQATLPLLGQQDLSTPKQRIAVREKLLGQLKRLPEAQKQAMISQLPAALAVEPPPRDRSLFLTWDQVRELVANGVACQPHTVTHPILTRIPVEEMRWQLKTSRDRIITETEQEIIAFAYPNGLATDINASTQQALRDLGYKMAFTMAHGPIAIEQVHQHLFTIPRISPHYSDNFEAFLLRVHGFQKIKKQLKAYINR